LGQIYIDTSLVFEALEAQFPESRGYGTIYPSPSLRPLIRGFGSYWTDRAFFRVTTGLIPGSVWRTHFGQDRSNLIGHKLDSEKLAQKVPENLSGLDLHLSILEPLLLDGKKWLFDTEKPSAGDITLFYQLDWGEKIARGEGVRDLTGGGAQDGDGEGLQVVFNPERYPNLSSWFRRFKDYLETLPLTENRVERNDDAGIQNILSRIGSTSLQDSIPLIPTPVASHESLDARNGLSIGAQVSVAPDDTGRGSPTLGTLLAVTAEEVVISPQEIDGKTPLVGNVRVHFPRLGFVVRPVAKSRL
jgi:glutathione S-transferase